MRFVIEGKIIVCVISLTKVDARALSDILPRITSADFNLAAHLAIILAMQAESNCWFGDSAET